MVHCEWSRSGAVWYTASGVDLELYGTLRAASGVEFEM
jgi:hypothetical protein